MMDTRWRLKRLEERIEFLTDRLIVHLGRHIREKNLEPIELPLATLLNERDAIDHKIDILDDRDEII